MFSDHFFTISDFAKLMGLSRQTLIYYDHIGLFRPAKTLENGYRLYARSQINAISLISMLGEIGVPLREIREIVSDISPDTALEILQKQQREVQEKLHRLQTLSDMIDLRMAQITLGKEVSDAPEPTFSFFTVEEDIPLYLGKPVNAPMNDIADEFIIDFYAECERRNFPLIFACGQVKSRENILAGRTEIVSRMCFTLKDAAGANAVMSRGEYAVGYLFGGGENTAPLYRDLLAWIAAQGRAVAGDAYEEYLLDELAESDPRRYVMRVMIPVTG